MKQNVLKFRSSITVVNLPNVMRSVILEMEPNVNSFGNKGRPDFHINNVDLGCFCCNIQFLISLE